MNIRIMFAENTTARVKARAFNWCGLVRANRVSGSKSRSAIKELARRAKAAFESPFLRLEHVAEDAERFARVQR